MTASNNPRFATNPLPSPFHKVRLSVYREFGPDQEWRQQAVGFDVELRALILSDGPHITYHDALVAYETLRTIGAWAFCVLDTNPQVTYEFDAFDQHVIEEGSSLKVELFGHVYHRDDVRRPLDEAERRAVDELRERLRSVGVRT